MTTYEITLNNKTKKDKEIFLFLQQHSVPVKLKENAKMTKEEFDAMIKESREQYARGEYFELKPEDQKRFLGLE